VKRTNDVVWLMVGERLPYKEKPCQAKIFKKYLTYCYYYIIFLFFLCLFLQDRPEQPGTYKIANTIDQL